MCRYVGEICFKLDTLKIVQTERIISLTDSDGKFSEVQFEDEALARLWEKYISFWLDSDQEEENHGVDQSRLLV